MKIYVENYLLSNSTISGYNIISGKVTELFLKMLESIDL